MSNAQEQIKDIDRSVYDHYNAERLVYKAKPGVSEEIVREISRQKNEPEWMLKKRLQGLELFHTLKLPDWGPDLTKLDLSKIHFFMRSDAKKNADRWEDVPPDIRKTYDRLGIPEAEKKSLAGVGAQY